LRGGTGTLVPYAHAGIGARLSSQKRTGDDSELRGSLLATTGGGLDVSLPGEMILGISAQFTQGIGDENFSFEAGMHAGYAWGAASSPLLQAKATKEKPNAVTELQSD